MLTRTQTGQVARFAFVMASSRAAMRERRPLNVVCLDVEMGVLKCQAWYLGGIVGRLDDIDTAYDDEEGGDADEDEDEDVDAEVAMGDEEGGEEEMDEEEMGEEEMDEEEVGQRHPDQDAYDEETSYLAKLDTHANSLRAMGDRLYAQAAQAQGEAEALRAQVQREELKDLEPGVENHGMNRVE